VASCEERIVGIPHLLQDVPGLQAIILDDAFQHRSVNAGLNILLTEFSNIYTRDFFLPTGDLRDEKASAQRAQIIIVTKCPSDLTEQKKLAILREIKPLPMQRVFFTTIQYDTPYHIVNTNTKYTITQNDEVLLVCGIANPKPLKDFLLVHTAAYYQQDFSDHHIFSIDDLKEIINKYESIQTSNKLILTTEKDAVRLTKFNEQLSNIPLYVIPIRHHFLFDEGTQFNEMVVNFIQHFNFNTDIYEKK
jgi:tetraacyldisaccharide 4'-kinase